VTSTLLTLFGVIIAVIVFVVAAFAMYAALVDSVSPSFDDAAKEDMRDFLRFHVYSRYTQPPLTQLLQRQYGHPALRHRQSRHVHHCIAEPAWRNHAAEAEAAEAAAAELAVEAESPEANIARADAERLEFAY
jgi:hypothetical protein